MPMEPIASIYVEHHDAPNISGRLDLSKWKPEQCRTLDELVRYTTDSLIALWEQSNNNSIAAATLPRTQMLEYFWSKRPTAFTIRFTDGTCTHRVIKYPKVQEYTLA